MRPHPTSPAPRARRFGALGVAALASLAACGSPGAGYPDRPGVEAAQASWCDTLAKIHGGPDGWEHLSDCKSAYPDGSPAFVKAMATCYAERIESYGENAPDSASLREECTQDVVVKLTFDEPAARELLEARCGWNLRCQQTPVDECKAGFNKLDSAQRILVTTKFNAAAQHRIAECLSSSSCSEESEEAAFTACYQSAEDKVVWFPQ
jgi:hypothetical protein